ncbi:MAG: excinuclease ABC subunit UvrC [Dehalococcoidia bacterium]|nr:excinuclease ABC subunit UvrC [Dehalococcoidia bacterium]
MNTQSVLHERLPAVPLTAGVYLFRDATGKVLYVGKATILRQRLRSYFGVPENLEPKTRRMVAQAADLECIVTDSASEALILENTLIKRHRPPFNSRLKDDKTYPYIKIDLKEPFPQVYFTRRVQPDGARYFGPYASAKSVRRTMDLLKKLFPYRSCTKPITGHDPRPCLEYYIHRCVAPCIGAASQEEYRTTIQQVILFLEGKVAPVVRDLRRQMAEAAQRQEYERAAVLRDQIRAIERVAEEQKVSTAREENADVIGLALGGDTAWVEVFPIRRGNVIGRDRFVMEGTQEEPPSRVLANFVKQYYNAVTSIPPTLLVQYPLEDDEAIGAWLAQRRGGRVSVRVPQRGEKAKLLQMVAQNASQGMEESRYHRDWLTDADALEGAMAELQEEMNLPRLPRRVECYDISNIQGAHPVGSMVVLVQGKPAPAHYRRFQIKGVEGIDDYAMMQEMLRRRFKRLGAARQQATSDGQGEEGVVGIKQEGWGVVPDLVLIDGGKGHLSAALQVFLELGIDFIPLASLAKENEELFTPQMSEPVVLPRSSPALFLVQRARDEAHRFAITYHRKVRSRESIRSALDDVPGIGPRRKRALMLRFGTVRAIREAASDDLAAVPGMTQSLAQKVKDYL